jgi:hypothetical protein
LEAAIHEPKDQTGATRDRDPEDAISAPKAARLRRNQIDAYA